MQPPSRDGKLKASNPKGSDIASPFQRGKDGIYHGIDRRESMKEIDCRGMACPQPVLTTKKALEEIPQGKLLVIVDNLAARDNVERFAKSQGAKVEIERRGNDFYLHIQRGGTCERVEPDQRAENVVVYINSNLMGIGDEALGVILMRSFLKTLLDLNPLPSKLIFVNSGVRLTTEGSEVLDTLRALSEKEWRSSRVEPVWIFMV